MTKFNNNKYYEPNPFSKNVDFKFRRKKTRKKSIENQNKKKLKNSLLKKVFLKHEKYIYEDETGIIIQKSDGIISIYCKYGLLTEKETSKDFRRYIDLVEYIDKFYNYDKLEETFRNKMNNGMFINNGSEYISNANFLDYVHNLVYNMGNIFYDIDNHYIHYYDSNRSPRGRTMNAMFAPFTQQYTFNNTDEGEQH